jgi:hypothetical protein
LAHDLQGDIATQRKPRQGEVFIWRFVKYLGCQFSDGFGLTQADQRDMRQLGQIRRLLLPETGIADA